MSDRRPLLSTSEGDVSLPRISLHVNGLKFKKKERKLFTTKKAKSSSASVSSSLLSPTKKKKVEMESDCHVLRGVSFSATPGELTVLLSDSREERRTLVELISQSCTTEGIFDGEAFLTEDTPGLSNLINSGEPFKYVHDSQSIAFVSEDASQLYTPGLSYVEMLTYQARLRLSHRGYLPNEKSNAVNSLDPSWSWSLRKDDKTDASVNVDEQVNRVLKLMGLLWCKDKIIASFPSTRGPLGGETRKLAIALSIIHLPPVIILDDPTVDLDIPAALDVVTCMSDLSRAGHTVVCSLPRPPLVVFDQADKVVMLSSGYCIYAGPRDKIQEYITSRSLDFVLQKNVDLVDFVFDIADGTERPMGCREDIPPDELQARFESSSYYTPPLSIRKLQRAARACFEATNGSTDQEAIAMPSHVIPILPRSSKTRSGGTDSLGHSILNFKTSRSYLVICRAFYVKFREWEHFLQQVKTAVVLGLLMGYFIWKLGMEKEYLLDLLGSPYNEIAALSANMWLLIAVLFGQQVSNVHLICQKLKLFRYERRIDICPPFGFWFATLISEIPSSIGTSLIAANIVYFMAELSVGVKDYLFFISVVSCVATVGISTAIWLAAVFRKELIVRDLFLLFSFLMTISNGYLFHFDNSEPYIEKISRVNFMRWAFEALMVWKYEDYPDGEAYLTQYDFEHFRKQHFFRIALCFFLFNVVVFYLGLRDIRDNFYQIFCCQPQRSLVRDRRGQSSRVFEDTTSSRHDKGLIDESGLSKSFLSLNGFEDAVASRGRVYSGVEEDGVGNDRASSDLNKSDLAYIRTNSSHAPKIFARETSVSSQTGFKTQSSYSRGFSSAGNSGSANIIEEDETKGPTVTFKNVSFSVDDADSPVGYKTILHPMTGRFEWGRLNVIMGAAGSGKSSLLSVLAGQLSYEARDHSPPELTSRTSSANKSAVGGRKLSGGSQELETTIGLKGSVWYNHKPLRTDYFQRNSSYGEVSSKPWERCGFVESEDLFHMDLTVQDLRLDDISMTKREMEQNVSQVMDLVQLMDQKDTKTRALNRGGCRRLSIAEEIVHGPTLVLIDEPFTSVSPSDASIISGVLRELVNQDRNVIVTMHQPPESVFSVVDSLALLSQGHLIFMGMAEKAPNFFLKSPKLELHQQASAGIDHHVADFLMDLASGLVRNDCNDLLGPVVLAEHYKNSNLYTAFKSSSRYLDDGSSEHDDFESKEGMTSLQGVAAVSVSSASSGSSFGRGKNEEKYSHVDQKSVSSHSSSNAASKSTFTSKYMTPSSDTTSSVVSPYRPRSMSRYATGRNHSDSITEDLDDETANASSLTPLQYLCSYFIAIVDLCYLMVTAVLSSGRECFSVCFSLTQVDVLLTVYKCKVLLSRNFDMFYHQERMLLQTTLVIVMLALCLGFIIGPSSNDYLSVLGMFALGNLCIILTNMQYISFLYMNNQVFLKEHSRGLYTTGLNWATCDFALLSLRTLHSGCYGLIIHYMIHLRGGDYSWFFYLNVWVMFVAATQITMTVVHLVSDIRGAYRLVPVIAFILFYSSGLIVRPSVLHSWLQPWLPSVSLIRWFTQGLTINEYDGNTDAFPQLFNFDSYTYALSLFGWGGKSKWYCFNMLIINLAVFRVVMLLASIYQTVLQRGQRYRRKKISLFDESVLPGQRIQQ